MDNQLIRVLPSDKREEAQGQLERLLLDPAMEYVRQAISQKLKTMKSADYDNPAWAYKQAHDNGYNEALAGILKLIHKKD